MSKTLPHSNIYVKINFDLWFSSDSDNTAIYELEFSTSGNTGYAYINKSIGNVTNNQQYSVSYYGLLTSNGDVTVSAKRISGGSNKYSHAYMSVEYFDSLE